MIAIGTRLGAYQITSLLGQGGMGEVYRATDTKLNRDVALKLLPEQFTLDRDRLERFQREAHVLASLNHSNIAAIYGFEDAEPMRALVMELVEGSTVAERIAQGPMPVEDVLTVAKQIAEALEYAHEHGVIHRDLKPANIKLTSDGKVKILDFGLAKAMSNEAVSSNLSNSPTLSLAATQAGVILGTAAYMSPEQAKGKSVDRRADIWAFGVIVYEMLSGQLMFSGETASETMAQVIMKEPDWNTLPAHTPSLLRDLMRRCLNKDPLRRLRDIGDARISIEETISAPKTEAHASTSAIPLRSIPIWRRVVPWVLAVALVAVSFLHLRERPQPAPEQLRFSIFAPEKLSFAGTGFPRVSPDGRHVVFNTTGENGTRLWVRDLNTLESRPLAGTDGVTGAPFWSLDSSWVVFGVQGKLKKIQIGGGPAQTLCDVLRDAVGGFWTGDNKVVFGGPGGLFVVPATGGTPSQLTIPDRGRGEVGHVEPSLLPDGVHFVYTRYAPGSEAAGVYIGSLNAKPEQQGLTRLLADFSMSVYVPGFLLFARDNTLLAEPFDGSQLKFSGDAFPIAEQVGNSLGVIPGFSASATGVLAYFAGGAGERHLTWYDRQGRPIGMAWTPASYGELALSPDGDRVSVVRESGNVDIHVFDFLGNRSIRLTSSALADRQPVWSPDAQRIAFYSPRAGSGGIFVKSANGTGDEEALLKSDRTLGIPKDWSSDGRFLIYGTIEGKSRRDLWIMAMDGEHKVTKFLQTEANEAGAKFAPEGQASPRYVAYTSDESGKEEVYVTTFPDPNKGKWPISSGGGYQPRWRRDGKELLYFTGDGKLMSVDVTLSPAFKASAPKLLFQAPISGGGASADRILWDLTPDGQKFLINTTSSDLSAPIVVVMNWQATPKK